MSTLADPPLLADHRVLFCRVLEKPRRECMVRVIHSTKIRVKFETVVMIIFKELISMLNDGIYLREI